MQSRTARLSDATGGSHTETGRTIFHDLEGALRRSCGVAALVLGLSSGGTAWAQSQVVTPMLLGPANAIWRCMVNNASNRLVTDVVVRVVGITGQTVFESPAIDIKPKATVSLSPLAVQMALVCIANDQGSNTDARDLRVTLAIIDKDFNTLAHIEGR